MIHDIVMKGGAKIGGCCNFRFIQQVYSKYYPRDILYNIHAARKGKLEKVVLKERLFLDVKKTYGRLNVIYKDTFNGLWNESDLIFYEEAYHLIDLYFQRLVDQANKLNDC